MFLFVDGNKIEYWIALIFSVNSRKNLFVIALRMQK